MLLVLLASSVYPTSYSGDGTYTVKQGDIITADNGYTISVIEISWALQGDTAPKITFSFDGRGSTAPLYEGDSRKFGGGAMGGQPVLEAHVNSINKDELSASVTVTSIYEREPEEKQPEIPIPEEEKLEAPPEGKTYRGDGIYTLAAGDSVEASNGVVIKVAGFIKTELRWVGEWPAVQVEAYKEGIKVVGTHLLSYKDLPEQAKGESGEFTNLGLGIIANDVDLGKKEVQLSVSSSVKVMLQEGWNLFSVPLRWDADSDPCENAKCYGSGNNGLKVVESTCGDLDSLKIWHWDAEQKQYVKSLPYTPWGYWVKAPASCYIRFGRETVDIDGLQLKAGWNQIGAPTKTKSGNFENIRGNCNVVSGPWRYLNQMKKYEKVLTLASGEGYFVKVSNDCILGETNPPTLPQ